MDFDRRQVVLASGEKYEAEMIITSIPWAEFSVILGMPEKIKESLQTLKSSAIETRYVAENLNTKAQWIYIPDSDIPYHRILIRHNFCNGSKGYWLETRKERTKNYKEDGSFHYMNEYAYPLNTISKPAVMKELLAFARSKKIYGLGRWGEHCHYNSDLVVELAMNLVEGVSVSYTHLTLPTKA